MLRLQFANALVGCAVKKSIPEFLIYYHEVICWIDIQVTQPQSGFYFISKEEYIILTGKDI